MVGQDQLGSVVSYAMNAQWEALPEPNVFGFRPGRCTQDAIQVIRAKSEHFSIGYISPETTSTRGTRGSSTPLTRIVPLAYLGIL